jgi:predicted phage gp36 major capsid-like protein
MNRAGKGAKLTSIAADDERLRELDADMRRAWGEYSERLRELSGEEYERVEHESWEQLQAELRELERERASLAEH